MRHSSSKGSNGLAILFTGLIIGLAWLVAKLATWLWNRIAGRRRGDTDGDGGTYSVKTESPRQDGPMTFKNPKADYNKIKAAANAVLRGERNRQAKLDRQERFWNTQVYNKVGVH